MRAVSHCVALKTLSLLDHHKTRNTALIVMCRAVIHAQALSAALLGVNSTDSCECVHVCVTASLQGCVGVAGVDDGTTGHRRLPCRCRRWRRRQRVVVTTAHPCHRHVAAQRRAGQDRGESRAVSSAER